MVKLNIKSMALAGGITWASLILLTGITGMFGWGTGIVDILASLYLGYKPTILGAIIGGAWGFLDGAITLGLIAYLYNRFTNLE